MVKVYDRLKNQCVRCKYSYVDMDTDCRFQCILFENEDCIQFKTPCIKYVYNPLIEQTRQYYNIIDGNHGLNYNNVGLSFHTDFFEPIIDGVKVSTTRLEDKLLQVNDVVTAKFGDGRELDLKICYVEKVKYKYLNQYHSYNEGYFHKQLLKHELTRIYPSITDDTMLYIYHFSVMDINFNELSLFYDNWRSEL